MNQLGPKQTNHDDVIKWKHFLILAICAGNSPVPGEFPAQRPVTQSFDVFFDLCLNKWLSKQSWGWWFETVLCPLSCHCNGVSNIEETNRLATCQPLRKQTVHCLQCDTIVKIKSSWLLVMAWLPLGAKTPANTMTITHFKSSPALFIMDWFC